MSLRIIVAAAVFLPIIAVILLLGIAAYRGRWHSWHGNDDFFHWPYAPLAGAWFGASMLLVMAALLVGMVVPVAVVAVLVVAALLLLLVAILVYVHSPRWLLPGYVRWLDGDAGFTERPACLDTYRNSRLNRVMRKLTLDPRQEF
ncbi:hypothetical protein [Actinomadura geliboluensis]|uniref:hypothetical protein n=1 Tax=Actinomadura geliboluensis TaxID=882440 RepID=UPI0036A83B8E